MGPTILYKCNMWLIILILASNLSCSIPFFGFQYYLSICSCCSGRQIWFTSWSRPCLVNVIKFAWKWLRVSAAVFVWIESRCSWLRWGYQIIGTAAKQIQSLDTAWCRGQGWPELGTGKQFCWRRSCELGVKWCFHTILLTRLPGTVHVLQTYCKTHSQRNWWWILQRNTLLEKLLQEAKESV